MIHYSVRVSSIIIALLIGGCSKPSATTPDRTKQDDYSLPIADFALTERNGKLVRKADLHGKVWIASFVFTRCNGPCPQVTATMARLQKELAGEPNVRLVTFTVDPARDDPDELKKYAELYRADRERWLFLTGKEATIHDLLKESFKISVVKNEHPQPGEEFDHSTWLAVVDQAGNVRGHYQGMADPRMSDSTERLEADLKRLKAKVATLLRE